MRESLHTEGLTGNNTGSGRTNDDLSSPKMDRKRTAAERIGLRGDKS